MQNRVAYHNPHSHPEYIGGVMVPAGETREIDATHHPDYHPPESGAVAQAPQHIVDVLLVGDTATLLAHIPALGADDLQTLSDREQADGRRDNVLSALAERLLTVASEQLDDAPGEHATATDTEPPAATAPVTPVPTAAKSKKAAGQ